MQRWNALAFISLSSQAAQVSVARQERVMGRGARLLEHSTSAKDLLL